MFTTLLLFLTKLSLFTGSYSLNVFKKRLSSEEETIMINKMLEGDKKARNTLIEHNLRLVAHIVKKFDVKKESTDDLISIGTIGLIKAVDTYKPSKNTKITTYAARCIQNEILMYFRSNKKRLNDVSLNDVIGVDKEGNEISLINILSTNEKDLTDEVHTKDLLEKLEENLKVLTRREKNIIIKRYGLYNTKSQTQKEIAKELNISRSYVSRIEKRALTKVLKEFIKN